ncbi:glycosyltransferase, partial [Campylobacter concisus]|uniref:glycosyltransferase n=1 Tax=Campylobacter concisus TaxID=199 RepID=UPI00112F997B
YESFSNVVLEALSFKNIVFTTAQNGAAEILENCFIMREPNDESILELVEQLLNDNDMMRKLQEKSFLLSQKFSIEENASKTLEIINEVLNLEQK